MCFGLKKKTYRKKANRETMFLGPRTMYYKKCKNKVY